MISLITEILTQTSSCNGAGCIDMFRMINKTAGKHFFSHQNLIVENRTCNLHTERHNYIQLDLITF